MDPQSRKWDAYNRRTFVQHRAAVAEAEARKRRGMTLERFVRLMLQEQEKRRVG
jgi:hypothetical protein